MPLDKNISLNLPLAMTIGEPAGVGPELILSCWQNHKTLNLPPFIALADPNFLEERAKVMGLSIPIKVSTPETAIDDFKDALPVLPLSGEIKGCFGNPSTTDAALVCESISTAVDLAMEHKVGGIVTAPINKKALYDAGFTHPGHTEFLAELAKKKTGKSILPVMMLAGPELRTIPVTIHIALNEVPKQLTKELIVQTGEITHRDLVSKFGIEKPRIAIAGMNPHAGEDGSMGMEDIEIVAPAIKELQAKGINAFGPLPSDTLFHTRARSNYDVVLCMYHDQALIPAKTLAFDDAVNVTLGLPFIRTSPDHGTAYDIAGKGIAKPDSMIAALKMAHEMATSAKSIKS